jgi:putative transposase
VRQPECNGCVERFIRTLKEQLLWVKIFQNVEELRCALAEFRELYNQRWIVQRLDYLTPAQARQGCTPRKWWVMRPDFLICAPRSPESDH